MLGVPTAQTYTQTFGYDAVDHVKTVELPAIAGLPAETITSAWDAFGKPTTLKSTSAGVTTDLVSGTGYDVLGRLASRTWGNAGNSTGSWKRAYTYDWHGRLATAKTTDPAGTAKQADSYTYAGNGPQLLGVNDDLIKQQQCYQYDPQFRLARAWTLDNTAGTVTCNTTTPNPARTFNPTGAPAYDQRWTIDADNTITKVEDLVAAATTTLTPPTTAGQPPHAAATITTTGGTTPGTTTQVFDANGALTTRTTGATTDTTTWDVRGRMTKADTAGVTTEFAYGPDGSRLIRKTPTETTLTLGTDDIVFPNPTATPTGRRYYGSGGARVALRTSTSTGTSTLAWLAADTQASTDITITPSATTTGTLTRTRYTPYGDVRTPAGPFGTGLPLTDKGWLGKTYDTTTGLNHLNARYYNADLAQFTAPDPLFQPTNPRTINPYTYANANPITYSDPTGLIAVGDTGDLYDPRQPGGTSKPVGHRRSADERRRRQQAEQVPSSGSSDNGNDGGDGWLPPLDPDAVTQVALGLLEAVAGVAIAQVGTKAVVVGVAECTAGLAFAAPSVGVSAAGGCSAGAGTAAGGMVAVLGGAWMTADGIGRVASNAGKMKAEGGVAAETGTETAQIGSKLEYFLGNATGDAHNVERSVAMERQLNSIGVFDNAEGRALLEGHLRGVFDDASSVVRTQENERVVRDGLLVGPRGVLKTETVWDGNKLITGTLFGRG